MVYKIVSSDRVIAKIFRDFKPSNSGWIKDALEWMGEGLEIIGSYSGLERKPICLEVEDHKVKIPCNVEEIEAIVFHDNFNTKGVRVHNHRLPFSNGINSISNCCSHIPFHATESCSFNPNYIQTSFRRGKITVYALVPPTDCNGLPMIPDNVKCITALSWYCISMMLLRGFKHQTIDYKIAFGMWEKFYPQAQNSMEYPDIERYEQFKRTWTATILNVNLQSELFNDQLGLRDRLIESGTITNNGIVHVP